MLSNIELIEHILKVDEKDLKLFKNRLNKNLFLEEELAELQLKIDEVGITLDSSLNAHILYLKATLSYYLNKPHEDTLKLYHEAIELKNSHAANDLAIRLLEGQLGNRDNSKAIELLNFAISLGNVDAMNNLAAISYSKRQTVTKCRMDYAKELLDNAIELGDADAMYHRALICFDSKENEKAIELLDRAIHLKHVKAMRLKVHLIQDRDTKLSLLNQVLSEGLDDRKLFYKVRFHRHSHNEQTKSYPDLYSPLIDSIWKDLNDRSQLKLSEKINLNLYQKIYALIDHGEAIKGSDQDKGSKIASLGLNLNKLYCTSLGKEPPEDLKRSFQDEATLLILQSAATINHHRNLINPIIINLLIAGTIIGLVAIAIKTMHNVIDAKIKDNPIDWNRSFFFSTTRSQDLCDDIVAEFETYKMLPLPEFLNLKY